MGKRVFMFPGQGSQYIGMGKEFYDTMPNAKAVIDLASEQTGLDIPALCFEENDKLGITEYTQICMLAVEAAIYQAIIDKGITPDVTAGLSLGEYGALIASGAMTMADAFAVVRKRGIYMQEAVPTGGAMTAVLGLDPQVIEDICKKTAVSFTPSFSRIAVYCLKIISTPFLKLASAHSAVSALSKLSITERTSVTAFVRALSYASCFSLRERVR